MPNKAYMCLKSVSKTLYRLTISHKNLLEWTTSEEAEKQAKTDLISYYKNMSNQHREWQSYFIDSRK